MHHSITYNVELYLRYKNIFGDRVELWNTVVKCHCLKVVTNEKGGAVGDVLTIIC
jgi:hypothetical protein